MSSSYRQNNSGIKPLTRSQLTPVSSTKPLSKSQYQEGKNIPNPNAVRKLQQEQPASVHLIKSKADPSQQINHYSAYQGSSNQKPQNLNISQSQPQSRGVTPTKSPQGGKTASTPTRQFNLQQQTLTPSKTSQIQEEYFLPQEQEIERRLSSNRAQEEPIKRGTQPIPQQNKPKQGGGILSCFGGGGDTDSQKQPDSHLFELSQQEIGRLNDELAKSSIQHQQEKQQLGYQIQQLQDKLNQRERASAQPDQSQLQQENNLLRIENAKLRSDNKVLSDSLHLLGNSTDQKMREQSTMEEIIKSKIFEIENLKKQANEREMQIQILSLGNQGFQANGQNNQRIKELEQNCLLLTNDLENLNRILAQKSEQLEIANQQLNSVHNDNQMIKKQNGDILRFENSNSNQLQDENAVLADQVNFLNNRNKQLEKDLIDAGQKMKNYNLEIDKLEQVVRDQAGESIRTNEKLARDNQQLQAQIQNLSTHIKNSEQQFQSAEALSQQLTQVVYQQEKKIKDLEGANSKTTEFQKLLKDLQSQRDILSAQKDSLSQQLAQKEGISQQKDSLLAQKDSSLNQRDHLLQQKDSQVKGLIENESLLKRQLEEANTRLQGWRKESDRIKEDKSKDLALLQNQLYELKVQNQKLTDDKNKLQIEYDQLQRKSQQEAASQIEILQKNLQIKFGREKDQLVEQTVSLNNQLQKQFERNNALEQEKVSLDEKIKKTKNVDQDNNNQNRFLLEENDKLKNNLQISEMNIQSIQRLNEEQRRKLEDQKRALEDQIEANKREKEILQQQIRQLKISVEQIEDEKKRMLMDFDFKLSEQERQYSKQNKGENELNARIAELQRQLEIERINGQDYNDLIVQHNAEKTSLDTRMLKLNSQINEKDQEIQRLTQENKILTAQGTERLSMIENWKKSTGSSQIGSIPVNIEESKRKIQDLEEKILKEKHEKTTIQNQMYKYESELKNKEEEVQKLYELIEKRKSDQEKQKENIDDLRKLNEQLSERAKQAEAESLIKTEYYDRWFLENDELQRQVNYYKQQLKGVESSMVSKSKEIEDNLTEVKQLKNKYEEAIMESKNLSKSNCSQFSPHTYQRKEPSSPLIQQDQNNQQQITSNQYAFGQLDNPNNKYSTTSNYDLNIAPYQNIGTNQARSNSISNLNTYNQKPGDQIDLISSFNTTLNQKPSTISYNPIPLDTYHPISNTNTFTIVQSNAYVFGKNDQQQFGDISSDKFQYQSSNTVPQSTYQNQYSAGFVNNNDLSTLSGLNVNLQQQFHQAQGFANNVEGNFTPRYASPSSFEAKNQQIHLDQVEREYNFQGVDTQQKKYFEGINQEANDFQKRNQFN